MNDRVFHHYLMCRTCRPDLHPIGPFESPEARAAWQSAHTAETGHDDYLVRDQPDDGEDWL